MAKGIRHHGRPGTLLALRRTRALVQLGRDKWEVPVSEIELAGP